MDFLISVGYIAIAILVLLLMILIHELGHYLVGRWLGFKIDEFSIGFGKAIFQKTNKRGEKISLRIFPLGGYCLFHGDDEEMGDKERKKEVKTDDPEAFNNQKPWKRVLVFISGAAFNFISAILFAFILLVSYGYDIRQVTELSSHNIVNQNLQVGDVIYAVDDENIDFAFGRTFEQMMSAKAANGATVTLTIRRDGEMIKEDVTFYKITAGEEEYLVIGAQVKSAPLPFLEALLKCVPFAFGMAWVVLKALWMMITFQVGIQDIGGPIATISFIATAAQANFANILFLIPAIAANLAVFNLLPFPALDGAHVVFTGIEWVRKKPVPRNVEAQIHFWGLMALLAFVVVVDVLHFVL